MDKKNGKVLVMFQCQEEACQKHREIFRIAESDLESIMGDELSKRTVRDARGNYHLKTMQDYIDFVDKIADYNILQRRQNGIMVSTLVQPVTHGAESFEVWDRRASSPRKDVSDPEELVPNYERLLAYQH